MSYTITCRARISGGCFHGDSTVEQFGENLPMSEDGTFVPDNGGGTIVCDACYIRLMPLTPSGMGLNEELDGAIDQFRQNIQRGVSYRS